MADTATMNETSSAADASIEESQNIFIAEIQQLISNHEVSKLNAAFYCDENKAHLDNISWDLVPVLCACLTDRNNRKYPKLVDFCEQALVHLAKNGNAKELLLGLLEQADSFKDDIKFKTLLHAIQIVLLRLPNKRHHSLEITLETLYAHILCLELPKEGNLEGSEKKILDSDPKILRIGDVISALLTFLKPFINEIKSKETRDEAILAQRKLLVKYLLKLLHHPMVFLDLTIDENGTKSLVRVMSELLIKYVAQMCGDFHRTVAWMNELTAEQNLENDGYKNVENDLELGVACFVYLIHGEKMQASNFPSILRAEFVFLDRLPFANLLLQRAEPFVITKGTVVVDQLLAEIPDNSVQYHWLENDQFTQCVRLISQIVIRCSSKEIRQQTLKIFPKLLSKFDARGKNSFLYYVMNISHHSGLTGFIVQLLKQEIDRNLKRESRDENFTASKLGRFYSLIFRLTDGETTDILENFDSIMAAVNLLRYLLLRDKPEMNATGIWNVVANININYVEKLLTGVQMSRAHYEMELKGLKEDENKKKEQESNLMSVTVGGLPLPKLPKDQQLNIVTNAIHSFDMMQSVVLRVQEIIDLNKKVT